MFDLKKLRFCENWNHWPGLKRILIFQKVLKIKNINVKECVFSINLQCRCQNRFDTCAKIQSNLIKGKYLKFAKMIQFCW